MRKDKIQVCLEPQERERLIELVGHGNVSSVVRQLVLGFLRHHATGVLLPSERPTRNPYDSTRPHVGPYLS